jgi:hypothetical protein
MPFIVINHYDLVAMFKAEQLIGENGTSVVFKFDQRNFCTLFNQW